MAFYKSVPSPIRPLFQFLDADNSLEGNSYMDRARENVNSFDDDLILNPLDLPTAEDLLRRFKGEKRDILREAFQRPSGRFLTHEKTKYYFSTIKQTFNRRFRADGSQLFIDLMSNNARKADANDDFEEFIAREYVDIGVRDRFCSYLFSLTDRAIFSNERNWNDDWFCICHSKLYGGQGLPFETVGFTSSGFLAVWPLVARVHLNFAIFPIVQWQMPENRSLRVEKATIQSGLPLLNHKTRHFADGVSLLGEIRLEGTQFFFRRNSIGIFSFLFIFLHFFHFYFFPFSFSH